MMISHSDPRLTTGLLNEFTGMSPQQLGDYAARHPEQTSVVEAFLTNYAMPDDVLKACEAAGKIESQAH